MGKYCFGIDVGGTSVKCGLFQTDGVLVEKWEIPTRKENSGEAILPDIAKTIQDKIAERKLDKSDVDGVGIGVPGPVNERGEVPCAVNLFWGFKEVTKELTELTGLPSKAGNDANVAALGEAWKGAAAGSKNVILVTLGTGVGGGIILNGRILEGDNGAAGELGHMVIHQNGHPCTCGRKGCLEAYASAAALVSRAREAMERSDESMLWSLCKGDLSGVNGRMIFEASEKGDSTACEVLDGFMEDLSEGIANIINILQPEILCIGGGLSGAGEALLAPVKEKTAPKIYSRASQKNTRILLAELGNGAGIIGAACLNEQR